MRMEYPSFAALAAAHREGEDYERLVVARAGANVVLLAPHGGRIEPRTDELAQAIAATDFSLYCFRSKRPKHEANLHITSHNFDDPACLSLVAKHKWAVAIHGCSATGERVFLGGRDATLVEDLASALCSAGVRPEVGGHAYPGTHPKNICNRTATSAGAQIELSMRFRKGEATASFVAAVRSVLLARQGAA